MYSLPHFKETNEDVVFAFMEKNSFVNIVGYDGEYPVATHVPVSIKKDDGKIILTGHVMKHTNHYRTFAQNENVLVIFNGPHCYVSASWYEKKEVASTWNYIDVQAKGTIRFYDSERTKEIIHDLTNHYESEESDAAFNKLPTEYIERLINAIIGFTIEISNVENVFKLSQNHNLQTRKNIIEKLSASNDAGANAIAVEMRKRLSE